MASEETSLLHKSSSDEEEDVHTSSGSIQNRQCSSVRMITVEPVTLLYMLYMAAMTPLQQQYLYMRIGQSMNITGNSTVVNCFMNKSDTEYIDQMNVQSETSLWMIYLKICSMVPAFFSTIFLGGYSDKGGRKIALICPVIGGILKLYVFLCIIIYDLPIYMILISAVVEGMFGSMAMFLMGAFSYISDITTTKQRSLRIIILEVCLGLSGTIAYISSGFLIKELGYLGTTIILHMIIVLTLFVIFFLPETLNSNEPVKFLTLKHFLRSFKVYLIDDGSGRRAVLFYTVVILFFVCPARLGADDVSILFMLDSPLCWNSVTIGYFKGFYYLVLSIAGIVLTKIAQPRCGDLPLVIIGCVSACIHTIYWAFAHTTLMMFLVPFIGIFTATPIGMLRSFCSKIVSSHELGAMFSWVAWLELLGSLIGDVGFNATYQATLSWFNGFVFFIVAFLYLCGGIVTLALFLRIKTRRIQAG